MVLEPEGQLMLPNNGYQFLGDICHGAIIKANQPKKNIGIQEEG